MAPLIFIHYGNPFYLKYVLESIQFTNPNRECHLIGDASNKWVTDFGWKHFLFKDYLNDDSIKEFRSLYKPIGNKEWLKVNKAKTGEYDWTEFNFIKFKVLRNHCQNLGFQNIWYFDSDLFLLKDLEVLENELNSLSKFDFLGYHKFSIPQGYIKNLAILDKFHENIIEVYSNSDEESIFREHGFQYLSGPFGYTMMRAFFQTSEKNNFNAPRIGSTKILNYSFDECWAQNRFNHATYTFMYQHYTLKKYFIDKFNNIYIKNLGLKEYEPLWGINMSWIPEVGYKRILKVIKSSEPTQFIDGIKNNAVKQLYIPPDVPVYKPSFFKLLLLNYSK